MNTHEIFDAMSYLDENLIAEHTAIRFSRITAKANLKRKNIIKIDLKKIIYAIILLMFLVFPTSINRNVFSVEIIIALWGFQSV